MSLRSCSDNYGWTPQIRTGRSAVPWPTTSGVSPSHTQTWCRCLVTRPLATPLGRRPLGMLRPLEDVLALLTSAGFSGADALHIYRVLFGYLHGHILTELQEVIERPEETDDVLRLGLHRLTVTEFPQVRALASALANYDGAAELDRGVDLLLLGLTATLTPPDGSSRS